MLEYEKKIMLKKEEYVALLKTKDIQFPIEKHTNYYFDTDDLSMNQKNITCRIRAKNGKYKATIKNHNTEYPDCSIEASLPETAEYDSTLFRALGLCYQGELFTERITLYKAPSCKMVMDHNAYLGQEDFELEVEYQKEHESEAIAQLERVAKNLTDAEILTKSGDFMQRIGQVIPKSRRFFGRRAIGGRKYAVCFR